jgi:small subunit ribosomal protein S11
MELRNFDHMGKKRIIKQTEEELAREGELMQAKHEKVSAEIAVRQGLRRGVAHILATYNNTMVTLTDERGAVLGWASAGMLGFKGTKKATPFAAARVAEAVAEKAKKAGVIDIVVLVKGVGSGRESAIRSLANRGLEISLIKDITPLPHNGPRPKKVRRV